MIGCGPCSEPVAATPRAIDNEPGRTSVAARIGTHGSFLATCLQALASQPALAPLSTRDPSDPTIALLDAAAAILDVLTFYRERITNEGYLGTATERRSVLELARTIGYELNPGAAAKTWLAFTLETAEGSPSEVTLPAGTRAQSVPGQGEKPQIFETTVDVVARPEWNALPGRTTEPKPPKRGDTQLTIAGTSSNLTPGDRILLVGDERRSEAGSERWDYRIVVAVETFEADPNGGPPAYTLLTLDRGLGSDNPVVDPSTKNPAVYGLRTRAALFGHNAIAWSDLALALRVGEINPKTRKFLTGPYAGRAGTWANAKFAAGTSTLWLDQPHDSVTPGAWLILSAAGNEEVYEVTAAVDEVHSDFLLSGPTTRVGVRGENIDLFSPKNAVVWAGAERFELAEPPRTAPITGTQVPLDDLAEGIERGRLVAVSGTDVDTGDEVAEVRAVAEVYSQAGRTRLVLETGLTHRYDPLTVRVNANVAPATHGESWSETLGDGDARRPWLRFKLSNAPLTYVRAPTATGGKSTLTVRVGGIAWREVETLYGAAPQAPVYTVRHDEDGAATVEFGPASRPPTGKGNITATYRVGIGTAGNVDAGTITTPLSRPLGLRGLTNPIAATSGADPDETDDARRNAPLPIRALGRVVSLDDYESFAAAFAGITKARADAVWTGERRIVHLTVATVSGETIDPSDQTIPDLLEAVDAARHVEAPVVVAACDPVPFELRAAVDVDPRFVTADVLDAVSAAVAAAFSFEAQTLAQPVFVSEVLSVMQGVPGVDGVVLQQLHPVGGSGRSDIVALPARRVGGNVVPAQLAVVADDGIQLTERKQ
jgi:predicted phage baseplate assembly protein